MSMNEAKQLKKKSTVTQKARESRSGMIFQGFDIIHINLENPFRGIKNRLT